MHIDTTVPGVTLWMADRLDFRFHEVPAPPEQPDSRTDRQWQRLCAANPRLFPGPIVSVHRFEPHQSLIFWNRDTYKNLAVQPQVHTGASLLAVTGLLTWRARGEEHILLARRSRNVFIYPGMWELGPAGGITPPPPGHELDLAAIQAQLQAEFEEEFAMQGTRLPPATCIGVARDAATFSHDLLMRVEVDDATAARIVEPRDNWEYDQARWVSVQASAEFVEQTGGAIIPPAKAVLAWLRH